MTNLRWGRPLLLRTATFFAVPPLLFIFSLTSIVQRTLRCYAGADTRGSDPYTRDHEKSHDYFFSRACNWEKTKVKTTSAEPHWASTRTIPLTSLNKTVTSKVNDTITVNHEIKRRKAIHTRTYQRSGEIYTTDRRFHHDQHTLV